MSCSLFLSAFEFHMIQRIPRSRNNSFVDLELCVNVVHLQIYAKHRQSLSRRLFLAKCWPETVTLITGQIGREMTHLASETSGSIDTFQAHLRGRTGQSARNPAKPHLYTCSSQIRRRRR